MPSGSPSIAKRFAADETGQVAVLFGIMAMAILLAAGIAVDYARTISMNSRIAAAADAASLAAGRALIEGKLDDEGVKQLAKQFLRANADARGALHGTYTEPEVTVDRNAGTVHIDVGVSVPTTVTRITGREQMDAPVETAAIFRQLDLEVSMALDVTGSMSEYTPDRKRKIDALKTAFSAFVDKLLPQHMADGRSVRIAVAPYSSGINMGRYANAASGSRSRDGCVIERTGSAANSETPAGKGTYFKVHEDQPKDTDSTEGQQAYTCPDADIIPLTDQRELLTRTVGGYRASGSTGGHLGLQWAWNLISEDWAGFWGGSSRPEPYAKTQGDKPELVKAIILMSDGIFNTSFYNGMSSAQAETLCSRIKARNVLVFSVAFGNPPTQAKRTLERCATPGPEYYADASSSQDLQSALSMFADTLTKLRLTQ